MSVISGILVGERGKLRREEGKPLSLSLQPQCTLYSTVYGHSWTTNSDKTFNIRIMAKSHKDKVVHKAMKSIDKFYNEVPGTINIQMSKHKDFYSSLR